MTDPKPTEPATQSAAAGAKHYWPIHRPAPVRQYWAATSGFFVRFVLLGVAIVAVVLIAYVIQFGDRGFSNATTDWAAFGEYVGGTAGGLFGLLAFVAVLMTLRMQQHQLNELKRQASIEEIQRLLASVSRSVDTLLAARPDCANEAMRERLTRGDSTLTVFGIIAGAGTAALQPPENADVALLQEYVDRDFRSALELQTAPIVVELHQLAWAMLQHQGAGGSEVVREFYELRYGAVVCWLDALKVPLSPVVEIVFPPDVLGPILAKSSARSMSKMENC